MLILRLIVTMVLMQILGTAGDAGSFIMHKQLHTSFLVSPLKLYVGSPVTPYPIEPIEIQERLLLKQVNKVKTINKLNDMNGLVAINTKSQAISYVRLMTSPSTWFLLSGSSQFEIIAKSQAHLLPNYGLRSYASPSDPSGSMGILSEPAYKKLHIAAATVEQRNQSFIIKRWLLTEKDSKYTTQYTLQFVREDVSSTGAYHRQIMRELPAPMLPKTRWQRPVLQ